MSVAGVAAVPWAQPFAAHVAHGAALGKLGHGVFDGVGVDGCKLELTKLAPPEIEAGEKGGVAPLVVGDIGVDD